MSEFEHDETTNVQDDVYVDSQSSMQNIVSDKTNDDITHGNENLDESTRFYTYESNEFAGSNAQSKPVKRGFWRRATATVGFAVTFGIIAGVCIHFTGEYFGDKEEKTEISIGGSNTTVSGTSAISTTPVLNTDVDLASDVSEVAQEVMPSVVSITETSVRNVASWYGSTQQEVQGSGSGIIIKEDEENLFIVTNNHVIDGAKTIEVTFDDDSVATATVKGAVESEDIAVIIVKKSELKEDTLSKIKVASVGDSDKVKIGETAIAIGNALGYGQSVTAGVISATEREISVSSSDNTITITVLQTDAAINPGNSGGALLNAAGQVIGINSAKLASSEVEGMGYAIPISNVMDIITDIINKEVVTEEERGYLGIIGGTVSSQQQQYGIPKGVYVSEVADDGPAKEAGLLKGDIIVGINKINISSMEDFSNQVKSYKAGTTVTIKYKRIENGEYKEHETEVKLAKIPETVNEKSKEDDSDNEVNDNGTDKNPDLGANPYDNGYNYNYGYGDNLDDLFGEMFPGY